MNAFYWLAALGCGVVLTTQVATNKQLGQHLGNLYIPAVANMVVGLVCTLALTLALSRAYPTVAVVKSAPGYGWVAGGMLGAVYLTATILLAPKLGAGPLIGLVVTGQIVFSVAVDHFALFGFAQHAANPPRVLGCLLLIGGVALVSRF